jgi:hypothetical protein
MSMKTIRNIKMVLIVLLFPTVQLFGQEKIQTAAVRITFPSWVKRSIQRIAKATA